MQTKLGHLVFHINSKNQGFYRDLLGFLGWNVFYDVEGILAAGDSNGISLWFNSALKAVENDYDGPGLNHFAFHTESVAEVDEAAAWLAERGVEHLFSTPRHRPEFSDNDNTYYQIMFETPDRLLVEIVYIGPK